MSPSLWLLPVLALVLAALIAAAVAVRRHQLRLRRQREALRRQRAAAHVREIALAAQAHTGRADIAVMLLQLSCEMLEEAVQLAPQEEAIGAARQNLRALLDSLYIDDRPPAPLPNPEAQAELTLASMQLTEAARLLNRLETRAGLDAAELRSMQSELRRVQRSLDFRARMRRELEAPGIPLAADLALEARPVDPNAPPTRITPSH